MDVNLQLLDGSVCLAHDLFPEHADVPGQSSPELIELFLEFKTTNLKDFVSLGTELPTELVN